MQGRVGEGASQPLSTVGGHRGWERQAFQAVAWASRGKSCNGSIGNMERGERASRDWTVLPLNMRSPVICTCERPDKAGCAGLFGGDALWR